MAEGKAKVTSSTLNVRQGSGKQYKKVGELKKNAVVSYYADQNDWLQITYKNKTAYINKPFTSIIQDLSQTSTPADTTKPDSGAPAAQQTTPQILTSKQCESARSYNKKNCASICNKIQALVGVNETGTFDDVTVQAIAAWQKANGLTPDGKFGPKSKSKADFSSTTPATPAPAVTTPATPAPAVTTPQILTKKQCENAKSYNQKNNASICNKIQALVGVSETGTFDDATVQAIAAWQKANSLTPDGKFGPKSKAKADFSATTPVTTTPVTPTPAAPEKPATPTTTETPEETTYTGEKLLDSKKVRAAIDYNCCPYGENKDSGSKGYGATWKQIQALVGTAQTGRIDEASVQAIAVWQKNNGLEVDGKFGKTCFAKAGFSRINSTTQPGEVGAGGLTYLTNKMVHKRESGRYTKEITDLRTGKKFNVSWGTPSLTYHSDCSPMTAKDTETCQSILHPDKDPKDMKYWRNPNNWSWNGREAAMQLRDGTWISCAYHLRPHGSVQGDAKPSAPMDKSSANNKPESGEWGVGRHFCLYYDKDTPGGTSSCKRAAERAKDMSR